MRGVERARKLAAIVTTRSGSSPSDERRTARRSRPSTKRIAMNSSPSVSPVAYTGRMCGWSIAAAAVDSRRNRRRNASSSAKAGLMSFSATRRSGERWRAR